jgi:hypothetical protein
MYGITKIMEWTTPYTLRKTDSSGILFQNVGNNHLPDY